MLVFGFYACAFKVVGLAMVVLRALLFNQAIGQIQLGSKSIDATLKEIYVFLFVDDDTKVHQKVLPRCRSLEKKALRCRHNKIAGINQRRRTKKIADMSFVNIVASLAATGLKGVWECVPIKFLLTSFKVTVASFIGAFFLPFLFEAGKNKSTTGNDCSSINDDTEPAPKTGWVKIVSFIYSLITGLIGSFIMLCMLPVLFDETLLEVIKKVHADEQDDDITVASLVEELEKLQDADDATLSTLSDNSSNDDNSLFAGVAEESSTPRAIDDAIEHQIFCKISETSTEECSAPSASSTEETNPFMVLFKAFQSNDRNTSEDECVNNCFGLFGFFCKPPEPIFIVLTGDN